MNTRVVQEINLDKNSALMKYILEAEKAEAERIEAERKKQALEWVKRIEDKLNQLCKKNWVQIENEKIYYIVDKNIIMADPTPINSNQISTSTSLKNREEFFLEEGDEELLDSENFELLDDLSLGEDEVTPRTVSNKISNSFPLENREGRIPDKDEVTKLFYEEKSKNPLIKNNRILGKYTKIKFENEAVKKRKARTKREIHEN